MEMMELALQPSQVEQKRAERAYRLAVADIPIMRLTGALVISCGVLLNNRYFLNQNSMAPVLVIAAVALGYSAFSWLCLRLFYRPARPFDLSLAFLALDVPLMAVAVYFSGAERSWLFFILLIHAADQSQATFRRSFSFAIFGALCYGAMETWVVYVDKRPIAWNVFFAKVIFIFAMGVYIALLARTAERRRASMRAAMAMARTAILKLEEQSSQLREATARAEEASAAKSEFLAHMSHEMRTPLHGVLGMLQLAIDDETSPRALRQLDMARRSAESLLATIEDILDFSRIEARKIELEPMYFSMRDLVAEIVKPLGVTAAARGLIFSASVAADVPDSTWGDPLRLRQIVINLVGNSIKFTDAGEVSLRVTRAERMIRVEVRDTGIGIPDEQRHRIFEPFTQVDHSRARRHSGTGLGLTIVSRIVESMGGAVRVQSSPGRGTSVVIDLPLLYDGISEGPKPLRAELAGRSAVVIEPNATSCRNMAEILLSAGMEVTACRSVDELAERTFAVAVSAEEAVPLQPVVHVVSPLASITDDRIRVTRPVTERELIDAVTAALGVTPAVSPSVAVRQRTSTAGLHVLVAEDEAVSREFATEALRRLMHRVTVACDGEEALRALERQDFDVVLMDVSMPGLDGLEVTRRYRERERGSRTPVVALTAHSRQEDRLACLEAGMDAVLTKPIELRQLEDTIRSLTGAEPIVNAVGGDLRLLARVSEAFTLQTPLLLGQMRDAIHVCESEALRDCVHRMKGAVSNFEGDPSLELTSMLEMAARDHDFVRSAVLLKRLEPAVHALERRIRAAAYGSTAAASA